MPKIFVATKTRGFLLELFNSNIKNTEFVYDKNKMYETNSKGKTILSKLIKSRVADQLGVIQRIKVEDEKCKVAFSYNRFLKTNKKYIIYLENPLAVVHYSTGRNKTILGKMKLKKYFDDTQLNSIICLSKACFETLNTFYSIPNRIKLEQIYPLIHANKLTSKESIKDKCYRENMQCVYISSNFNLKGGKEILECFRKLKESGINNIKLKVVTKIDSLDATTLAEINQNSNIELNEFNFSKEELNLLYNESSILLNPSRQDSFSLVVLEAMKSGNTIISTDLYAIPEMVEDNYNGYLTHPKFRFFNYDNLPNEAVWNNRNKTIYSDFIDNNIVNFLYEKLVFLNSNRNELERLSLNSYTKSMTGEFSETYIKDKWEKIIQKL